jgi:hypothetical protein
MAADSEIRLRGDSTEAQSTIRRERMKIDNATSSPWIFSDANMEALYESDHRENLFDRARPVGQIYSLFAWLFKIPFFYSRAYSDEPWTTGELYTAVIRQCLLIFFTIAFFPKFGSETKRRCGVTFIWITRIIYLPLHMFHETGIPIFSTELITSQVCGIKS